MPPASPRPPRRRSTAPTATEPLLDELYFLDLGRVRRWARDKGEGELGGVLVDPDGDDPALGERTKQQFLGERLFDVLLDDAGQWARTKQRIIALDRQPLAGIVGQLDRHVAVGELLLELQHKLVDD